MSIPEAFNTRILVVDDNTAIHEDFRKIFRSASKEINPLQAARQLLFGAAKSVPTEPRYTLDSAYQGNEALEMVRRSNETNTPYALAFVDVRMPPGMDGIETIKAIWKESPDLQVAICTAYSDYSWQDMLQQLGSTDNMLIVKKPFDNIEVRQIAFALTSKWNLNRDRVAEQRALEHLKHQYEAILNSVGDGIHHLDADGRITYVNPAATRMFDWGETELLGKPAHATIHHSKRDGSPYPACDCPIYKSARDGVTRHVTNEVFIRRDGTTFDVEYTCSSTFDENGKPTGGTVVFKDISERKKAEAETLRLNAELQEKNKRLAEDILRRERAEIELINARRTAEEANSAKSTFLANMSHEIRTPMNGIVGMIYLMKQTSMSLKQSDYASKIDFAAHSLLGIINDILDFSKVEAGKITFERIEFNLDEVLSRLVQLTSMQAQKKNLELKITVIENPPKMLIGDPLRLGQVLLNLASNAIKFTQKGEVEISVRPMKMTHHDVALQFDVRDTGIGLEIEHLSRLFEPFSQSDSTTSRRYGGTGLGLAISKRFVNIMGGDITVQSELGRGSTFSFTVLFEKGTSAQTRSSMLYTLPAGRRVLVIDGNAASRAETCLLLHELSYDAVGVDSITTAVQIIRDLSQARTRGCDLALMDCSAAGMDWLVDAKRLIVECGSIQAPPVILIASRDMGVQHIRVEDAGYDSVLVKPVTRSSLFEAIMNASARNTGRRSLVINSAIDSSLKGARILVVEDNEHNQEIATEVLKLAGCEVALAQNGLDAIAMLSALASDWFAVVLTDVQMPGMDGYETARAIRSDTRFAQLPIIAMTADAIAGTREKCLEVGMNDYLTKPINPQEVYATLAKWVKLRAKKEPLPRRSSRMIAIDPEKLKSAAPRASIELTVLDTQAGIARVGGNRELYERLLGQFYAKYGKTVDDVTAAVLDKDRATARRLLHNIKGFAGNLGAQRLMRAAQDWEYCFKDSLTLDTEPLLRANFRNVTGETMQAIAEMLRLDQRTAVLTPSKMFKPDSSESISATLKLLAANLRKNDMDAERYALQLSSEMKDPALSADLKELISLIQRFNFPEALEIVKKLSKQFDSLV